MNEQKKLEKLVENYTSEDLSKMSVKDLQVLQLNTEKELAYQIKNDDLSAMVNLQREVKTLEDVINVKLEENPNLIQINNEDKNYLTELSNENRNNLIELSNENSVIIDSSEMEVLHKTDGVVFKDMDEIGTELTEEIEDNIFIYEFSIEENLHIDEIVNNELALHGMSENVVEALGSIGLNKEITEIREDVRMQFLEYFTSEMKLETVDLETEMNLGVHDFDIVSDFKMNYFEKHLDADLSFKDKYLTPFSKEYKDYIFKRENTSPERWFQDGNRFFSAKEKKFDLIHNFKNNISNVKKYDLSKLTKVDFLKVTNSKNAISPLITDKIKGVFDKAFKFDRNASLLNPVKGLALNSKSLMMPIKMPAMPFQTCIKAFSMVKNFIDKSIER